MGDYEIIMFRVIGKPCFVYGDLQKDKKINKDSDWEIKR